MLKSKTILVTGGTGSFGSTFVRRMVKDGDIAEVRVLSRDEKKQEDLRNELKESKVKFFIGDVRDSDSVLQAMRGVDFVFHAAALKQVPSCEFHPPQALKTNVMGAENIISSAVNCDVQKVIFLSTDKAVNPINVMGMTKALMEKTVFAHSRLFHGKGPVFCCTRYGNVMCSRGSVIPLFINQIRRKQPITVTNAQMTRFMMSLDESVDLVMYALKNGRAGDLFVQKSPAATIETLSLALQELFQKSVETKCIGMRHGEKLHESLVSQEEMARAEDLGRYYRIPLDERDLNYHSFTTTGNETVAAQEEYNSFNTKRLNVEEMKALLLSIDYVRNCLEEEGLLGGEKICA